MVAFAPGNSGSGAAPALVEAIRRTAAGEKASAPVGAAPEIIAAVDDLTRLVDGLRAAREELKTQTEETRKLQEAATRRKAEVQDQMLRVEEFVTRLGELTQNAGHHCARCGSSPPRIYRRFATNRAERGDSRAIRGGVLVFYFAAHPQPTTKSRKTSANWRAAFARR